MNHQGNKGYKTVSVHEARKKKQAAESTNDTHIKALCVLFVSIYWNKTLYLLQTKTIIKIRCKQVIDRKKQRLDD